MSTLTRDEGQLLLAAIRVLSHLQEKPPTPEDVAELLQISSSSIRLQLNQLQDLGAVALVNSAFETHAEVRDHLVVEELPEKSGPAISEDLRAFDLHDPEHLSLIHTKALTATRGNQIR